jgi:hypothetical protein
MTCRDVLDLVEPIAAGDQDVEPSVRAHVESCPRCASALASARRIELALAADEPLEAPVRFTPTVLARIRRERWRTEQNVDRLFNVAVAAALILVAVGVLALLNLSGVMAAGRVGWSVLTTITGEAVAHAAPFVATYVAAAGLLASALGMWWWAERRLSV